MLEHVFTNKLIILVCSEIKRNFHDFDKIHKNSFSKKYRIDGLRENPHFLCFFEKYNFSFVLSKWQPSQIKLMLVKTIPCKSREYSCNYLLTNSLKHRRSLWWWRVMLATPFPSFSKSDKKTLAISNGPYNIWKKNNLLTITKLSFQ